MSCALVKLKCWEIVIKYLDDICETKVQLSVHTVYKYGGCCCIWHGENIEIVSLITLLYVIHYILPSL